MRGGGGYIHIFMLRPCKDLIIIAMSQSDISRQHADRHFHACNLSQKSKSHSVIGQL